LKTEKEGIVRETSPLKLDISLAIKNSSFYLLNEKLCLKTKCSMNFLYN